MLNYVDTFSIKYSLKYPIYQMRVNAAAMKPFGNESNTNKGSKKLHN